MANEIPNKLTARTALTITLNGLASSLTRVGRQSTIVADLTNQYTFVRIGVMVTSSGTPTARRAVYVHFLSYNGTENTDNCGASDAAFTVISAPCIGIIGVGPSPSSGQVLAGDFLVNNPGRRWGIAVWHDTGVALHATAGNSAAYIGGLPEIQ